MKSYLAKNLRYLRKRKDVSQSVVSEALGLKRITYSKYEENVSEPNIKTLIKIGAFYNVKIDRLIKINLEKK